MLRYTMPSLRRFLRGIRVSLKFSLFLIVALCKSLTLQKRRKDERNQHSNGAARFCVFFFFSLAYTLLLKCNNSR